MDYWLGSKNPMQSLDMAIKNMERALVLTDLKGRVFELLGYAYAMKKDYDKAIDLGEKAIALVPNGADAYHWLAVSLDYVGKRDAVLPLFEKAMRLNPFPPAYYYLNCGHAHRLLGRFQEAAAMYKKAIHLTPNNLFAHCGLAAIMRSWAKRRKQRPRPLRYCGLIQSSPWNTWPRPVHTRGRRTRTNICRVSARRG